MGLKCKLGVHSWEHLDTDKEHDRWRESVGLKPSLVRCDFLHGGQDKYCSACGKVSTPQLDQQKKWDLEHMENAVLIDGNVILEKTGDVYGY